MVRQRREARAATEASVAAQVLQDLTSLPKEDIADRFKLLYERDPPPRMRREVLLRAVAYRLQENVLGGPDRALHRRLAKLAKALKETGYVPMEQPSPSFKPGSRLLRTWNNETHSVTVGAEGYIYRGETYRSLSRIARLITGTRWSGPAFFGLTKARGRNAGVAIGESVSPVSDGEHAPPDTRQVPAAIGGTVS